VLVGTIVDDVSFGDTAAWLLEGAPVAHQLFAVRAGLVICVFIKVKV